MAGLVPGHARLQFGNRKDVKAHDKRRHGGQESPSLTPSMASTSKAKTANGHSASRYLRPCSYVSVSIGHGLTPASSICAARHSKTCAKLGLSSKSCGNCDTPATKCDA